jgi:phage terminase large subunit-like protein
LDEALFQLIPGYDPLATADDCTFDEEAGLRPIEFFAECLTHVKGEKAGQPFVLEPWQKAIVANLFGWLRPDGTRRYREALIFVPRKQGKSILAASICNYMLFCDGEWGAEIYAAAAERDQAALLFDIAKQQVLREPVLHGACQVFQKAITIESMGSSFKAISADANTKHGFNAHCVVIDELHAQKNRELVDVLMTSTGARRQPLVIHITTSDFDRESICNEKHDYALKVRDGVIRNPAFLPVIYEASHDDDWTDSKVWARVNPGLGISVPLTYYQAECQRAKDSPAYENTFKRLHLNLRTEQDVRWLALDKWDACAAQVNAETLKGRECYAGLDLATTTDVAALVLIFPDAGGYQVRPYFWVPRDNALKREKRDRVPYITWSKKGLIELTDGNVVDYDVIRKRINDLGKLYKIRSIAIDRWNSTQLSTQLVGDGFELVAYGQGFKDMTAPSKELEKLVLSQKIAHAGNPVLRWMASNVSVEMDAAGNVKPSKKKSTEKIDGIVALVMALGIAMVRTDRKRSIYETRGLIRL